MYVFKWCNIVCPLDSDLKFSGKIKGGSLFLGHPVCQWTFVEKTPQSSFWMYCMNHVLGMFHSTLPDPPVYFLKCNGPYMEMFHLCSSRAKVHFRAAPRTCVWTALTSPGCAEENMVGPRQEVFSGRSRPRDRTALWLILTSLDCAKENMVGPRQEVFSDRSRTRVRTALWLILTSPGCAEENMVGPRQEFFYAIKMSPKPEILQYRSWYSLDLKSKTQK